MFDCKMMAAGTPSYRLRQLLLYLSNLSPEAASFKLLKKSICRYE